MVDKICFLIVLASAASGAIREFDVVIYGGTAGGAVTAIAAAREGVRVALVEPTRHIGGMVTGGLSKTDIGKQEVIGGIAREFFERTGKYYNRSVQWDLEPGLAERVMLEMVNESGAKRCLGQRLKETGGSLRIVTTVQELVMEDGTRYRSRIFVDATYEGDLLPGAGIRYTWGRESNAEYGESLAGVRGRQRPDHHFNVRVSPYDKEGKLLWGVYDGKKGRQDEADRKVQAYTFRMCLSDRPDNRTPYQRPENYDPGRYELLARLLAALEKDKGRSPVMREVMIRSALPNGKYDINSFGGFSTDYLMGSWDYPTANYRRRAEIWRDHQDYVAGFFWFLAHDERVPKALQEEVNRYGLCKDEFQDTGGWPYQLYVRESRRIIGEYVMSQKDIQTDIVKPDAMGMGSYQSDSHHVQRLPTADGAVENEGEMYVPVTPYHIPYRMILPKRAESTNVLVPVSFSATHVAYSTLRMEPQYMIIGQGAGLAAAMAIKSKQAIHDVDGVALSEALGKRGAVLEWKPSAK